MLREMRGIDKPEQELTESPLFYLLRRHRKDSKQFNHYFDQYLSHGRG